MDDLAARLTALEQAVADLQHRAAASPATEPPPPHPPHDTAAASDPNDEMWFLRELQRRHPEGAVVFAGHTDLPGGRTEWQWGRLADDLLTSTDDTDLAARLAALGHPVRLELLRRVLLGTTTTAALAETEGLGTSGQLHHHVRTLVAAGWLTSSGRGRYQVPPHRVIPVLAILAAAA